MVGEKSWIGRFRAEFAGPIAVALTSMIALLSLPFVILFSMSSDVDEIRSSSRSPDGRREIQIVIRDGSVGLIGSTRSGLVRLRRTAGWGPGWWEDVLTVSEEDVAELAAPPAWSDDGHVVVRFAPEARTPPQRLTAMGVEIEFRHGIRGAPPPAPPP